MHANETNNGNIPEVNNPSGFGHEEYNAATKKIVAKAITNNSIA